LQAPHRGRRQAQSLYPSVSPEPVRIPRQKEEEAEKGPVLDLGTPIRYPPREVLTNNAAVVTRFYGRPETNVEDDFSVAETRFRDILVAIDAGDPPHLYAADLKRFIWLQAVRTRAIREQYTTAADTLLGRFVDWSGTDDAQIYIRNALTDPAIRDARLRQWTETC
jgi:hypothetical protein